jgi:hypothetical protein
MNDFKPPCFANYPHKDFCFDSEHSKPCKWKAECFQKTTNTTYLSPKNRSVKCRLCSRKTRLYQVEYIGSLIFNLNSKTGESTLESESFAFMEYWLCQEHLKEQKISEMLWEAAS